MIDETLDSVRHLLTPEQLKRLALKLPYYSNKQIEKVLEEQEDSDGQLPEQKKLEDKSEGSS